MSAIDLPAELSGFPVIRVPSSHVLFREGSPAPLVFLTRGAVRFERGPVVLDLVRAPAWVLDPGVFDRSPALATAVTLRASSAVVTTDPPSAALRRALEQHLPSLLRAHGRSIDALSRGDAEERLLRVLSDLARRWGTPVGAGRFVGMPVRRRDLARMVGITIETASRILARLERAGSIRSRRDGIWIASAVVAVAP